MEKIAFQVAQIRHRLMEGVLLRLVRRPEGAEFILRGGLLMRQWFRPVQRAADDLDLIATFPFDIEGAANRILPALADDVGDGVTFDLDHTRYEGIWLSAHRPGARVFVSGAFGGAEIDFNVDVTFGPHPQPAPAVQTLQTECGRPLAVLACRPESVAGQKVQALLHRGERAWRAKDLSDLAMLFYRPMNLDDLAQAIAHYLADMGRPAEDARALFGNQSWWHTKFAAARWRDFLNAPRVGGIWGELPVILRSIVENLTPALARLR
ncbi:MAG: nucleotidyl transferase AbiEii/AbiGii toxin family protein [Gemmataceae bacterium]|nr:nucleotidyl transferase AbiEii/AbiGii toxin family protein [Gemmataceae bacterium]